MFEEEQDNKIYNLIITRGIDQENEYGQFTEKLYSKPDFLWTESMARDYAPFGESFFKKVDVIVILSGIYKAPLSLSWFQSFSYAGSLIALMAKDSVYQVRIISEQVIVFKVAIVKDFYSFPVIPPLQFPVLLIEPIP